MYGFNDKCVPIPCINYQCSRFCCDRTSCPLKLSFARTIDTFQGQTAGPKEEGKPPNDVERVILDPGSRAFEARGKTGIAYCMIGRGTTMGELDSEGKRMNSAFYFHDFGLGLSGTALTATRLAELRGPVGNPHKPYSAIIRRDRWANHLESNSHPSVFTFDQIEFLFQWAYTERFTRERIDSWIEKLARAYQADVP